MLGNLRVDMMAPRAAPVSSVELTGYATHREREERERKKERKKERREREVA